MILFLLFASALASGRRHTWLADPSVGRSNMVKVTVTRFPHSSDCTGQSKVFRPFKSVLGRCYKGLGEMYSCAKPGVIQSAIEFVEPNCVEPDSVFFMKNGVCQTYDDGTKGSYIQKWTGACVEGENPDMVTMAKVIVTKNGGKACQQNVFNKDCAYAKTESENDGMTETNCYDLGVPMYCPHATVRSTDADCSADGTKQGTVSIEFYVTPGTRCPTIPRKPGSVAFSKAAEGNVSEFVKGFAVLGFGFTLYGAYKHYSK